MKFKEYLKPLPIKPKRNKNGAIRVTLANRSVYWSFPDIPQEEIREAIKWLNKNKLEIPYGKRQLKELVR